MTEPGSDWARLFRIACSLIDQVNSDHKIIDQWSFGGGTAMMLQIDHRQSDDIDIFLPDPQLLSYLDPKLHDFEFEIMPSDYQGDGSRFLKLAFEDIGEIDFIASPALTKQPTIKMVVEGREVHVESVAEIITKKVFYRGKHIKPRDIFDIAAAAKSKRTAIIGALISYQDHVADALLAIEKLNPDFVRATNSTLIIRDSFRPLIATAIDDAKELLRAVRS